MAVAIAALAPGAPVPFNYDNFLWDTQILLAIFVAAQAPELVSSDQRHRVLSLYFSHALERTDYALAKLAALAAAVFGMALAPMLVLFFGRVLLAQDVAEAFGNEIENLPQVVVAPLLYAIPLAGLSLAIAAYTPRRAYATGAIIAVFLVTAAVSAILGEAVTNGPLGDVAQLINPFVPIDGTRDLLLGGPAPDSPVTRHRLPAVLCSPSSGCCSRWSPPASVLWRYRRVARMTAAARGPGAVGGSAGGRGRQRVALVRQRGRRQRRQLPLEGGITGLLGPNGAGKSTILHMIAGFLAPSSGSVTVAGSPTRGHPELYRRIGLVPEREAVYPFLTGRQFVVANARLQGMSGEQAAGRGGARHRPRGARAPRRIGPSAPTRRACGSGSRSPRRWSTTRRSCCSTSRSTAWTRASGCR